MRLIALKDIGDTIGTIEAGRTFEIRDLERAQILISSKQAEVDDGKWRGLAWAGQTVAILASGPSLDAEQCALVRAWRDAKPDERKVVAINTSYEDAPWADALYACDSEWWAKYYDVVKVTFTGSLWAQSERALRKPGLNIIRSARAVGLSTIPGTINLGGSPSSGGYQAIGLCHQAGAKRIILVGYDMRAKLGKKHHHADHPGTMNTALPFKLWLPSFDKLAEDLQRVGVEVVNATPGSALKAFPMSSLEQALGIGPPAPIEPPTPMPISEPPELADESMMAPEGEPGVA